MNSYSEQEKERIFIERTQKKYPAIWKNYCELVSHELMSRDELAAYNFERRREIVRFAYDNVLFYKRLYDSVGFNPGDLKSEEDWNHIPIVTKQMVRDNFMLMVAEGGMSGETFKRFSRLYSTGGSTGRPLEVYHDRRALLPGAEWRWRGWWLNRRPGAEIASDSPVFGQNEAYVMRVRGPGKPTQEQMEKDKKAYWPMERFYLDSQSMTLAEIVEFNQQCNEFGLYYMYGYVGAVQELAEAYLKGDVIRKFSPKAIVVTSTPFNHVARRTIMDAFACPAYDLYASNEGHAMAIECAQSCGRGLHVLSDIKHIDILNDENLMPTENGEVGGVFVTNLINRVMPLIKYGLGDRAAWQSKPCSCGLPFPLMTPVIGRESNYLIDKNGIKIHGLGNVFNAYPRSVKAFQFRQHGPGDVTLLVVKDDAYEHASEEIDLVYNDWRKRMEGRMRLGLRLVPDIPHDGGKLRFIVYENASRSTN